MESRWKVDSIIVEIMKALRVQPLFLRLLRPVFRALTLPSMVVERSFIDGDLRRFPQSSL